MALSQNAGFSGGEAATGEIMSATDAWWVGRADFDTRTQGIFDNRGTLSPAFDKWGTICINSRRALITL